MKVIFQIIRNHPTQSTPVIVILFDTSKYIFNIPETFQRFLRFHHFKISKGSRIFLTKLSTENITGLFGFLLTMYETQSCLETKIYGPKELTQYMESIKFLMGFKLLPYSCYNFDINAKTKHENTLLGLKKEETIDALVKGKSYLQDFYNMKDFIERQLKNDPNEINDASQYIDLANNLYKDENMTIIPVIFQMNSRCFVSKPANYRNFLEKPQDSKDIISYICITRRPETKIIKEKLASYNLTKPQTAELMKTGKTVLLDGFVLKKEDLKTEETPSTILMIIDCPTKEIAQKLFDNEIFNSFSREKIKKKDHQIQAMIHLAEGSLVREKVYQDFMQKFECEHVFASSEFFQIEENHLKLPFLQQNFKHVKMLCVFNHYFPDHFPNIAANASIHDQFFNSLKEITDQHHAKFNIDEIFSNLQRKSLIKHNHHYSLIPYKPGSEIVSAEFNLKKKDSFEETSDFMKNYMKFLNMKKKTEEKIEKNPVSTCNPSIVFLGTGSMIPSNYRNVSGVYIDYENFGLLLDCGEGTYFQLLNQYGFDRLQKEILVKLRIIFISHIHVDHHAGIFQIIYQRNKALANLGINPKDMPLYLVIPGNLIPWYFKYTHFVEDFEGVSIVLSQSVGLPDQEIKNILGIYSFSKNFLYSSESMELEYYEDPLMKPLMEAIKASVDGNLIEFQKFLDKIEIKEFLAVFVDHCPQAHGLVITHKSGVKIVYSGDTRPSDILVKYGMNATILIHEATFNDNLRKNAMDNMHCTVGEAVDVAQKMKVWRLILTHFSQRYTKHAMKKEEKKDLKGKDKNYYNFLKENTVFAYDHLGGKVSDFEFMPWLSHCMAGMFPEEEEKKE